MKATTLNFLQNRRTVAEQASQHQLFCTCCYCPSQDGDEGYSACCNKRQTNADEIIELIDDELFTG